MSSKKQMVINYVPGEECRVAIVENGRLEEFHAERMDGPSNHVGNIYVGKVMNVEQSIQAAFIDFGLEQNGFLHTSDVHPQYFSGEDGDKTERVGRKTPRRERPPIQDCFRRGDEVAVQVLKEGVGTKGPTVTSYLSIPGRFLVMMPQMDKVGVSRKVEDEETRRKMREILDQLDLPDGFGFILRTAGMERSKAELKRDLAYLMRLWKDMERRWKTGNKPRLLYSESDLLVRALRDMLTSDIDEVIVDNEAALSRAARFLKIVAPRTSTRLVHYTGHSPVFHVMGIEPQIQMIHAREVPLESGGRLVIDEAEALVAIDVNSGKSREARDSETNAYETNMEAVDEICRQLRLRDLGGVIVNDLIDMRSAKHRRDVETRFADNLKKDRARWTIAPISEFGILEMTRQRMRASHESQHFTDCPTCRGRGLVQKPDSVAGDALRELAALLDAPGVARVEIVVHPRIAGELLSTKRRALGRIERTSGKHVDVRVSEAILVDRVTFYAYDERGADLDIPKLGHRRATEAELVTYEITSDAGEEWAGAEGQSPEAETYADDVVPTDAEAHPIELEPLSLAEIAAQDRNRHQQRGQAPARSGQPGHAPRGPEGEQSGEQGEGGRRRRRRRGRRGRGGEGGMGGQPGQPQFDGQHAGQPTDGGYQQDNFPQDGQPSFGDQGEAQPYAGEGEYAPDGQQNFDPSAPQPQFGEPGYDANMNGAPMPGGEQGEGGRRRRRRRGRRGRGGAGGQNPAFGQPGHNPNFNEHNEPFEGARNPAVTTINPWTAPRRTPALRSTKTALPSPANTKPPSASSRTSTVPSRAPVSVPAASPASTISPAMAPARAAVVVAAAAAVVVVPAVPMAPVLRMVRWAAPSRASRPLANLRSTLVAARRGPQPDQHSLAAMFRTNPPVRGNADHSQDFAPANNSGGAYDGDPGSNEPIADDSQADFENGPPGPDGPGGPGGPGEPGDGTGPRRRRRRGRRGGRGRDGAPNDGGPGEAGGPADGPGDFAPPPAPAPRAPAPRAPAPTPAPKPAPRSQPTPAPAAKDKPKIRTLYVSRRRVAPTEIKNVKRED